MVERTQDSYEIKSEDLGLVGPKVTKGKDDHDSPVTLSEIRGATPGVNGVEHDDAGFKIGDCVSPTDRNNFGEITEVNGERLTVRFVNPQTGATAEKTFGSAELRRVLRQPRSGVLTHQSRSRSKRRRREMPAYVSFPVHILPEPLKSFVTASAETLGCDPAYVALPMLAVLAAAIGNARRIRVKAGWCEPSIIWALIIGFSGTLKSPALDAALRPIYELQRKAFREFDEEKKRFGADQLRYERDLHKWKKGSSQDSPPEKPEPPTPLRYCCSDTTVEAIAVLLQQNWRGLLLARDEFSGWLRSFNQYKGGAGSDVAHWLEMHGARTMTVDRKTGDPKTICVPKASVSIAGGIQPGTLRRALGQERFEEGLAARILFACPPRSRRRWTEATVPGAIEAAMHVLIEKLYALKPNVGEEDNSIPIDVDMTPAAKAMWIKFYDDHAEEQSQLPGDLCAAWSKLEGYAARLALIVHFVRWANVDPTIVEHVDETSIAAGIELSRWFGNEAKRVYAVVAQSDHEEEQHLHVEAIQAKGGSVSVREWQRTHSLATSADAEDELQELVEAGIGVWEYSKISQRGGHPSKRFRLVAPRSEDETPSGESQEGDLSVSVLSLGARDAEGEQAWEPRQGTAPTAVCSVRTNTSADTRSDPEDLGTRSAASDTTPPERIPAGDSSVSGWSSTVEAAAGTPPSPAGDSRTSRDNTDTDQTASVVEGERDSSPRVLGSGTRALPEEGEEWGEA